MPFMYLFNVTNYNMIDLFVYENFSLSDWLTMFEWLDYHVTNGVGKICRMHERIGTCISGCRTFKIESIRSHNMSNGHTKTITRMMTITVTTTVNNHSDNLI